MINIIKKKLILIYLIKKLKIKNLIFIDFVGVKTADLFFGGLRGCNARAHEAGITSSFSRVFGPIELEP